MAFDQGSKRPPHHYPTSTKQCKSSLGFRSPAFVPRTPGDKNVCVSLKSSWSRVEETKERLTSSQAPFRPTCTALTFGLSLFVSPPVFPQASQTERKVNSTRYQVFQGLICLGSPPSEIPSKHQRSQLTLVSPRPSLLGAWVLDEAGVDEVRAQA